MTNENEEMLDWEDLRNDIRLDNIERKLDKILAILSPDDNPTEEPDDPASPPILPIMKYIRNNRFAPQLMMAPQLRYLTNNDLIEATIARMQRAGLEGLHINVSMDWFTFDRSVVDMRKLTDWTVRPEYLAILENVRAHCVKYDIHLHVWFWGDSNHYLNPESVLGAQSAEEQAVYRAVNEKFGNKTHITFGVGWDLEEWLTVEHAIWIKEQLPDVFLSARHPTGLYDTVMDIPSRMHREYEEEDLQALNSQYPQHSMVFSEDRCRVKYYDTSDSGHILPDKQKETVRLCKLLGIMCIYGYFDEDYDILNPKSKDYRYGSGSGEFPYVLN